MSIKICLYIILFFSFYSRAQQIDSLLFISKNAKSDTIKCNALILLGENYLYQNVDSSRMYFDKVIQVTEKGLNTNLLNKIQERLIFCRAYSYYCLGVINMNLSKLDDAKIKFIKAQKEYKKINNKEGLGNCLNNIGYIYYNKGDISSTLNYYKKAAQLYNQINYYEGLIASYTNMAAIYNDQGDYKHTAENFRKSLFLSKKIKNDSYLAISSLNLGLVYLNHPSAFCQENNKQKCIDYAFDKALYLLKQSYILNEKIGDKLTNAAVLNNLGLLYSKKNQLDKALLYYLDAEKIASELNSKRILAYIEFNLAEVYMKQHNMSTAQKFAELSIKLAKETAYPELIKNASNVLKRVYEKQHKFKEALEMTKLFYLMKDSINNEINKKSNIKKQLEITFEKKAFADSLRSEKAKAIVQLQLEKKENQQKYLLLLILISIISIALIYNRFRINRKQKTIIEHKNKELERFNTLNQKIFSVISHDFKGPITTLKSLLTKNELIAIENPLVTIYIKDINTQLEQSDQMLESLLDWAKAELSLSFSEKQTFVLPVIHSVLAQLDTQLKAKNLEVIYHIDENVSLMLPKDVLKIVLRNLITNAIKYSFEGGKIVLEASNNILKVIDNGKGIEVKKLELLFNKQVASSLGTNYETGFGLGLYMCNELLFKNSAKLKAENNKDQQGCSFIVEIY